LLVLPWVRVLRLLLLVLRLLLLVLPGNQWEETWVRVWVRWLHPWLLGSP
jgi:hypothetical protein